MTTLFLAQRGLCTRQYMAPEELAAAHWDNVIYRHTARHWHARWARWTAPGEPTERFAAERIFTPREPATDAPCSTTGFEMRVVYHYDDERGTVREGPTCGPFCMDKDSSCVDGVQVGTSPAQAAMTYLMMCDGAGCGGWAMKRAPLGKPCAVELFLHHGRKLRMSAGVVHAADGSLQKLALVREDTRGPWGTAAPPGAEVEQGEEEERRHEAWCEEEPATWAGGAQCPAALGTADELAAALQVRGHG
jgi:hypothetical protein